jgi:hypothetical protein
VDVGVVFLRAALGALALAVGTALQDGVRRLLDRAVRARFGVTARRSVLRRTWTTVGDELVAHYGAVLDEFSVKCAVGVATPVPGSTRSHVA